MMLSKLGHYKAPYTLTLSLFPKGKGELIK